MSESDDKPFSVSDRRHFTPEGRPREEPPEAEKAPEASRPAEPPPPEPTATGTAAPPTGERPRRPVDFSAFVFSLGAQAAVLLSGGGDEGGGEGQDAAAALEGARQIVDILEMLQDKTEGRRTEQETRALEDLLFQLRLAYVERSRSAKR